MFRRILSWIFTPGTTEVSIDRSLEPIAKSWRNRPIDKVRSSIPVSAKITSNAADQATSLDSRGQRSSEFLLSESDATQETNSPYPQNEVLDTFADLRQKAQDDERRRRTFQNQPYQPQPRSVNRTSTELGKASPTGEKLADLDFMIPRESLTGMERTALYQIVGSRYVAETRSISASQLQIVRKFAGFDWLPSEREYWKGEYQSVSETLQEDAEISKTLESTDITRLPRNSGKDRSITKIQSVPAANYAEGVTQSPVETEEVLNQEQQRVFDYIENTSSNMLITGRAGSGKSFLLRYLLKHSRSRILPVAFMGIAALNIGGSTIHSAFKLPLRLLLPSTGGYIADHLSEEGRDHYREYRMLVIDEISMVAADQFVAMDMFLRSVNENDEPFGGVQVVLFGDPYQLPPIVINQTEVEFYSDNWGGPYFFKTNSWREGAFSKVELQGSERQSDRSFLELLDAMRVGELSTDQWSALQSRVVPEESLPNTDVVRIAPVNELADRYNETRLRQLPGTAHLFHGEATGEYRKNWNRLPAPMRLYLKNCAQVIMVKNDPSRRWVNGSVGRVSDVSEHGIVVEIDGLNYDVDVAEWDKESHTYDRASKTLQADAYSRYRQYPVALGWARTVHKSQGQTFDKCVIDLRSKMFEVGQAYVACSRTKSLDSLYFNAPLTRGSVMTSDAVRKFMSDIITPTQLPPF